MRERIIISWFLVLIVITAYGQQQNIVITDPSGNPVPDVSIRFANTALGTTSDASGKFAVNATGKPILLITAVGYKPQKLTLTDSVEKIILIPASVLLNNSITVTAERYATIDFDQSGSSTIVSGSALTTRAGRNIPESLIGSTGVWVQKTNHGGGAPIIRGLVGNQVLLMVDGIRINNSTYRYGPNQYLSTIDANMIDQVEVVRSGGSVLYGSDALGGTIQLLTETPAFSEVVRTNGSISSTWMSAGMEKSARLSLNRSGRRVAFSGGLTGKEYGDLVAGEGIGTQTPTGYSEWATNSKLMVRTGNSGVLTAALQVHRQHQVPRYDQVSQGGYDYYRFQPQGRTLAYLRWEKASGNRIAETIRLTGSYQQTREGLQSRKKGSTDVTIGNDVVTTLGLSGEIHSSFTENWQAQSGVEFYHDVVASSLYTQNSTGDKTAKRGAYADGSTLDNLALFTNHVYETGPFKINTGFRYNRVIVNVKDATFGNESIQPDAGVFNGSIQYRLNPSHRLSAGVYSGFRAPNVDDMSKFGPVETTVYEIPSAGLAPEKSLTTEIVWKSRFRNFSSGLSLYHTSLTNLIDRVAVIYNGEDSLENRRIYQKQNVGKAEVNGMEAEVAYRIKGWVISGNVAYTHGANLTKKEPMRRIPPVFGQMAIQYNHRSGVWSRLEWVSAGNQSRLAKGDKSDSRISARLIDGVMPGWDVLTIHAGYQYKAFSLYLSGINLANSPYRIYASGVDGVGRSLRVTLKATLGMAQEVP